MVPPNGSTSATLETALVPGERHSVEQRFRELVDIWRRDTEYTSSTTRMIMHPAYQQIIGMGPAVLPLLLEELKSRPDHWPWALTAITGVDPVPAEARGNLAAMTDAWLHWGRSHGYMS